MDLILRPNFRTKPLEIVKTWAPVSTIAIVSTLLTSTLASLVGPVKQTMGPGL